LLADFLIQNSIKKNKKNDKRTYYIIRQTSTDIFVVRMSVINSSRYGEGVVVYFKKKEKKEREERVTSKASLEQFPGHYR